MAIRYVVLRRRAARVSGRTRGPTPRAGGKSVTAPAETFDVNVLDSAQTAEAKRDPDFEVAAPCMPMKLIRPLTLGAGASASAGTIAWGIPAVGADTSPFDGAGTTVAVLDTGIDATHSAFAGVDLLRKDFTGEGVDDEDGHGTHCAGTIFGRDVNGTRVGVARGVKKALIGKVIGRNGGGSDQIVSAIQWAVDNGANVISMSLGIDFPGYQAQLQAEGMDPEPATSLALEGYRMNVQLFDRLAGLVNSLAMFRQPCLLFAASGNESGRDRARPYEIAASPPAVSEGFIAVAALQQAARGLTVASFSNTGAAVSAPGVEIMSAKAGGGLVALSGTSMATPHAAGVAALWAQKLKATKTFGLKPFATSVVGSATRAPLDPSSTMDDVGAGIVRAPQG